MYLSEITNSDMDSVIKWFILLLIIIGDPMAVLLIIIFTKIINNQPKKSKSQITNNRDYGLDSSNESDDSNLTVKEVVSESPKQSVDEVVKNIEENKIEVLENAVNLSNDSKKNRKPITINDIPEKKIEGLVLRFQIQKN
jgi:hypothetical protein